MKAIVQHGYGTPDVFELAEIDSPTVGAGDMLVRVRAASLHAGDAHIMRGKPLALRLAMGWRRPRQRPGTDIAGTVESVGEGVEQLQPGDEVFGWCTGGLAEFVCAPQDHFVTKPTKVSLEEAAAIGVSAFTALHAVRDQAKIKPGQNVLVNGASGGVGTFVVQVAKAFGAKVTGVCSTRNVDMVASIGADHVIDYSQEDFTQQNGPRYDFILDVAGNRSLSAYRRVLAPNGVVVPIGGPPVLSRVFKMAVVSMFVRAQGRPFVSMPSPEDLLVLKELVQTGQVAPVVDRTYPLAEVAEAMRYLGEGHAQGKVLITLP